MRKATLDPSVIALAPDGAVRRRYSQEAALALIARRLVHARWDRKQTRVSVIQFIGSSKRLQKPLLHAKAGTKYSYLEVCGNRRAWAHRRLPKVQLEESFGTVVESVLTRE